MTKLTIIGNLTADPELRFTAQGAAVANFTVADTPRVMKDNEWTDGPTLFLRCTLWNAAAENCVESLVKGTRVIVTGTLKQRSFETNAGEKRTVIELDVDEIGPSLKWATAKVNRTQQAASGGNGQQRPAQGRGRAAAAPADDPWGSTGGGYSDEPPF